RLNQRFSPELYLDVWSVLERDGRFSLGGVEDTGAIDYCLRMRQFDQADLLNRRIAEGRFEPADLERFVTSLAAIHQASPAHTELDAEARVRQVVLDNLPVLRRFAGRLFDAMDIDWLEAESRRRLEAHRDVLGARARAGRFRECHGDLHTGNI